MLPGLFGSGALLFFEMKEGGSIMTTCLETEMKKMALLGTGLLWVGWFGCLFVMLKNWQASSSSSCSPNAHDRAVLVEARS